MNRSRKLREERKRQEEYDAYYEREEQERKQESCLHLNCEIHSCYWNGVPKEVVCRECGLVNYLEDTEL